MDIYVHFDARQRKTIMSFTYFSENTVHCREVDVDQNNPYPGVRLDKEQVELLIQFMQDSLVASQMREPDFEKQRGVSVPVDTNPSRD